MGADSPRAMCCLPPHSMHLSLTWQDCMRHCQSNDAEQTQPTDHWLYFLWEFIPSHLPQEDCRTLTEQVYLRKWQCGRVCLESCWQTTAVCDIKPTETGIQPLPTKDSQADLVHMSKKAADVIIAIMILI